ncbi:MAG TPA: type IX secretion system membrane protein PorP/SprF [Cyclobacteriaceae bacterium]|nr:type IX secretion system membrane protein PorP/SprF [Cyclobacteriaceae bacterium]
MKRIRVTYVIGIALLFCIATNKADAQMFPSGGLPMLYNGGFAGEAGDHRLVFASKLNFMNFDNLRSRTSHTISYDAFMPSLRSGVGVMTGFMSDHYNPTDSLNWELRNPFFSVAFSPKLSFKGKWTFAPFVDFQFVHSRSTGYYRPNRASSPMLGINSRYTIRTGFLLNTEKGYVGFTAIPFERTSAYEPRYNYRFNSSFPGADSTIFILQLGRTFQKKPDSKFSFTPQVAVSWYKENSRHYFGLVDLNLAFRFRRFHTGIGAGGIQFAYNWDRLRVGTALYYSRPFSRSGHNTVVNGQQETVRAYWYIQFLSLRYLIEGKKSGVLKSETF